MEKPAHHNRVYSYPYKAPQDEGLLSGETKAQVAQAWWAKLDPARRAAHLQQLERQVKSRCFYLPGDVWE